MLVCLFVDDLDDLDNMIFSRVIWFHLVAERDQEFPSSLFFVCVFVCFFCLFGLFVCLFCVCLFVDDLDDLDDLDGLDDLDNMILPRVIWSAPGGRERPIVPLFPGFSACHS